MDAMQSTRYRGGREESKAERDRPLKAVRTAPQPPETGKEDRDPDENERTRRVKGW